MQLASRTGADPRLDFRQIVDEDLMQGHCNGEPLRSFLPDDLVAFVPNHVTDDKSVIELLCRIFSKEALRERLVDRFVEIGESVQSQVELHWIFIGLDYQHRRAMGMALQRLLIRVDTLACERSWKQAHCHFIIGNHICAVTVESPVNIHFKAHIEESLIYNNSEFSL